MQFKDYPPSVDVRVNPLRLTSAAAKMDFDSDDIDELLSQVDFNLMEQVTDSKTEKQRFSKVSAVDVDKFLNTEGNANTKRKTDQDM